MRVTIRWVAYDGRTGRAPGRFATVHDAELAARALLDEHDVVRYVAIYHETSGHVQDVNR